MCCNKWILSYVGFSLSFDQNTQFTILAVEFAYLCLGHICLFVLFSHFLSFYQNIQVTILAVEVVFLYIYGTHLFFCVCIFCLLTKIHRWPSWQLRWLISAWGTTTLRATFLPGTMLTTSSGSSHLTLLDTFLFMRNACYLYHTGWKDETFRLKLFETNLQYTSRNLWDLLLQHVLEPHWKLYGRSPKEESWIHTPPSIHPLRLSQALCLLPARRAPFKNYVKKESIKPENFQAPIWSAVCPLFYSRSTLVTWWRT